MRNSQWNEKKAYEFIESEPRLSLDKAEEILKELDEVEQELNTAIK